MRFRRSTAYPSRFFIKQQQQKEHVVSMAARGLLLLGCALCTAWLVFLSYPSQSRAAVAWLAWVPFIWGTLRVRRSWAAFFYGWFTAFLFHAAVLYWVYYTCVHGGGMTVASSLQAWLGLSALLSVQVGFFGFSCYFLRKTGPFFPFLAAFGFVTLEWLHQCLAFYGLGFPWLMWGYTQWNMPQFLQVASWTGVYGVSFILVLVSALIATALGVQHIRRGIFCIFLAAAIWLGGYWWGDSRLPIKTESTVAEAANSLTAAVMQPNIDQYKKWNPEFEQEIIQTIGRMGADLENIKPDLAVWPESVTPGALVEDPYFKLMEDIAERSGAFQVIGSSLAEEGKQYVGAYLMTPQSDRLQAYQKIKLVPFGEYIPFEKQIRRFFPEIKILGELGSFSPGAFPQPLLEMGDFFLGTTICYEAIFPQLWLKQTRQGAQLFVNLTNDAWFFNTAAPHQHLAANVLRAVETGRPILRAANTGISAVIDAYGRIEQKTELFTPAMLQAQVAFPAEGYITPYTQRGNLFVWVCAVFFFSLLISTIVFSYE